MRPLSLLVLLPLIASAAAQAPDPKSLEGTWSPIEFKLAGQAGVPESIKNFKLTITGNDYTLAAGKQLDKGTLKIDATKTPALMDVIGVEGPNKGKTILAIWKLDGEKLQICYALEGKDRPTAFESTKENGWLLATYQRARP